VLRHFHTVIDYPHGRLLLTPLAGVTDRYDRAGMWLGRHGTQFEVYDVVPGGPASIAGLKVGDIVTDIDRRKVESLNLFQIREQLADPAFDDPLLIDYARRGRAGQVTLRARALLPGG
jgi:S1-C subfamily serine protease